ncbi:helix-turn-helix domain-containing protein [Nonomuraea sp. NPDC049714]|uniref:helix-turn-helix domain-containing protein n=1 Tax=Nonomuraea sp. NPDC049714 TaxID=3364357 RepID=UPI0037A9D776
MRRSFKFLLRPTGKQAAALAACLEEHRELYNAALEHRRTAYRKAGVTVRYGHQSAELKHIRADDPDGQARWSFSSQQATLRRLDKAFTAFFKRVRAGRTPGFSPVQGARPVRHGRVAEGRRRLPVGLPTRTSHGQVRPSSRCRARAGPPAPPGARHGEDDLGEAGRLALVRGAVL